MGIVDDVRKVVQDLVASDIKAIHARLDGIDSRLESVETRMGRLENRMDRLDDKTERRFDQIALQLEKLALSLERFKGEISESIRMHQDVTETKLKLIQSEFQTSIAKQIRA